MPHISAKIFPGRSEEARRAFAEEVRKAAVDILGCERAFVTVSVEEIPTSEWYDRVYLSLLTDPHLLIGPQYELRPDDLKNREEHP